MEPDPGPIAKLQSAAYSFAVLRASPRFFNSLQSTVYSLQLAAQSVEPDSGPIAKLQSTAYSFAVLRVSPRFFRSLQSIVTVYSLQHSLWSQIPAL